VIEKTEKCQKMLKFFYIYADTLKEVIFMAMISSMSGNSPISADLMYRFYDNKAITPQIREALQKRQDMEDSKSAKDADETATDSKAKKPNDPGPATRVNISEQIIRMNMASKTAKPEDLKSRVKVSPEVQEIEKKLAEQKLSEKNIAKEEEEETVPKTNEADK